MNKILAYEVTDEDVHSVLEGMGFNLTLDRASEIFEEHIRPQMERISEAASETKDYGSEEGNLEGMGFLAGLEIAAILREDNAVSLVQCSVCGKQTSAESAHIHQDSYIGDNCCWDERLRASE